MDWTTYLFRFDGRINRAMMWQALAIVALIPALAQNIWQLVGLLDGSRAAARLGIDFDFDFGLGDLFRMVDPDAWHALASTNLPTLVLKVLGISLFLWIYLATAIKRLHDRNRSGWWLVPFFFAPNVLLQLPWLPHWFTPLDYAILAPWLWGMVEMFFLRGSTGNNRFGSDPLAESGPATTAASPLAKRWDQQREIEIVPPSASPPGGMHVKRGA